MPFEGGPQPFYPAQREVVDNDTGAAADADIEWVDYIRFGGAGDTPDTPEQQQARYKTDVAEPVEVYPCSSKYVFRKVDLLVTCSHDYTIRTWDCNDNFKPVQFYEGHFGMVNAVVPYRGTQLLSCADDCTLRLWQRGTEEYGELLMTFYINKFPTKCLQALPGQRALIGGLDKILRVVSLVNGQCLMQFRGHELEGPDFGQPDGDKFMQKEGCGAVSCCLHIKENLVVSGSDDSTIRFWDIDKGECLGIHIGHKGYGKEIGGTGVGIPFSEKFAGVWRIINLGTDGKSIASCSFDRTVSIWDITDIKNANVTINWLAHDNGIQHIGLVAPGYIATSAGDKDMKVWNIETGTEVCSVRCKRGYPFCVQRIDDDVLAMCGGDTTVRIIQWSKTPGDKPKDLKGDTGFNAHDFIISDCGAIYFEDEDEKNWTKDPILYCTIDRAEGEHNAQECIDMHKSILQEGLTVSYD